MPNLLVEQRGPVTVATLHRPAAHNAFDHAMVLEVRDFFAGLHDAAERPHAVVLRAEGKHFCAGGDLNDMRRLGKADYDANLEAAHELGEMFRAVRLAPVPVVARVAGGAFGGGVGLICACDIVVADPTAFFALTEARLGLVAGVISPLVIGRVGVSRARTHCLLGEKIDAVEAHRIGLVDVLTPEGGLDGGVNRTVRSLLKGGPEALGKIKELVEGAAARPFGDSLEFTACMIAEARMRPEAQKALQNFFDRKPAPWVNEDEEWSL